MTRLDRRKFGFWYILWEQNKLRLIGWEGVAALIIGTGGSIELIRIANVTARVGIASDFLLIISVLLGIVLAAFALVVGLSESYTLQLQRRNPKGIRAFFAPFMINIGVDVGLVIGTIAYRTSADYLPHGAEKTFFVIIATLFVYAVLNVTALARSVMAHGVTRAGLIEMDELESELRSDRPSE